MQRVRGAEKALLATFQIDRNPVIATMISKKGAQPLRTPYRGGL
jgi:hypothetical protein